MKLSIIIPVYNVEKYLQNCLMSLINQIKEDCEVLLVDDGSTDTSSSMCDDFAEKYKYIRVFHKENCGVSSARNFGIDKAKGEYLTFIDPDDYVTSNYFATVYNFIDNIKTDCLFFNLYREELNGLCATKKLPIADGNYNDSSEMIQYSLAAYHFFNASYTKIYKTSILKENNIRFNENIKICEDNIFSLDYNACIKTYTVCDAPLYVYKITTGSATQKRKLQYFADDNFLFLKYLNLIENKAGKNLSKDKLFNTYIRRCFYNVENLLKQKIDKKEIKNALNNTKMCSEYLLKYKFTSDIYVKTLKRRLKAVSKGHWLSYHFYTNLCTFLKYVRRVLIAAKFQKNRWHRISEKS